MAGDGLSVPISTANLAVCGGPAGQRFVSLAGENAERPALPLPTINTIPATSNLAHRWSVILTLGEWFGNFAQPISNSEGNLTDKFSSFTISGDTL